MRHLLIILSFLSYCHLLSSQVFWNEDFANGIPADWEIDESTNVGLSWTYCPDTTSYSIGGDNTCPHEYSDPENGFQSHFKSKTSSNGYATCVLEPFLAQLFPNRFLLTMTTDAIDCSDKDEVYLAFQSHIGLFENPADVSVKVRVSTDKMNWTEFSPFPRLVPGGHTVPGFIRWSNNAEEVIFDITSIASREERVYIQWWWNGNDEYHWSIDDIELSSSNPLPDVDLTLYPSQPFQAIMPNFRTPVSQIDTAFFLTDIGNFGKETQVNVVAQVQVLDSASNLLYESSVLIPQLEPNEVLESITFPPYYHEAGVGEFKILYHAIAGTEDAKPENNLFESTFIITEAEFAKHADTDYEIDLFPTDRDVNGFIEADWGIANHFYIPNGEGYFLDEIQFEIPNNFPLANSQLGVNQPNTVVRVFLYEWNNTGNINLASQNEFITAGSTNFKVTGADGGDPILLKLQNQISQESNIPLKDNQHYLLAIEYDAISFGSLFSINANTLLNYEPVIEANNLVGRNRFASLNKVGNTSIYNTLSFGGYVTPHLGLTITEDSGGVSTVQRIANSGISIFPNPVDKIVQVDLDFEVSQNSAIELHDINGALIRRISLNEGQNSVKIDCSLLPNANYLLTFKSEKVIATSKLIVLH